MVTWATRCIQMRQTHFPLRPSETASRRRQNWKWVGFGIGRDETEVRTLKKAKVQEEGRREMEKHEASCGRDGKR